MAKLNLLCTGNCLHSGALLSQLIKNVPAKQETLVRFLGQEDPLEKEYATLSVFLGFPGGSAGKESACSAGNLGSIPGLGRSPGGGHGNPPQYSEEFHRLYSPWDCKRVRQD